MALIQSGATADLLTVDPTSKAARVTLYDNAGNEVLKPPTGAYVLPVSVTQSAATAANSTVWAMRYVTGSLTAKIRRIRLAVGFNGTAAAATSVAYHLCRFSTATPTGGTAIGVIKKRNSYAGSVVTDARFLDTGLTVAGVVFETPFAQMSIPVSVTGVINPWEVDFVDVGDRFDEFALVAGEGLAIRLDVVAVAGQIISGYVEWDEVA